ncbi:tRNA (adenosine(37)-N6)-threonylcarbamoyltransferase complex ATPase subunit type 1 TsaE, partial [Peptoniphilus asaccharolyticus]
AQNYHQSMKYVAPVRKMLGIKTVFNLLGPLTNPAGANMQLLGVYDESLVRPMAEVLMKLGVKRGMVVYGQERLDEISVTAPTTICDFTDGTIKEYVIEPENFGIERCKKEDILGGEPAENAKITLEILNGELGAGKTTLTKSIAKGMGIEDYITSPTFNIINEYYGDLNLYHFDTYRLENVEEVSYLGFDEYFYGEGVCVIEWADRIKSFLPEEYLEINIREDRTAQLKAVGEHFEEILEKIEC